jgi:chromosomal replication initiator protein
MVMEYMRSQCNDFGMAILDAVGFEGIDDGIAYLTVPDQFRETWLNSHYGELLRKAFASVVGSSFVDYRVRQIAQSAAVPEMKLSAPAVAPAVVKQAEATARTRKKSCRIPKLYANYTFENFVEGDCNNTALKACLSVVDHPGDMAMNPLLVYGATGLGKTHLLHAVAARLCARNSSLKVVYRQAYDFLRDTMDIVRASSKKNWTLANELKERFQGMYIDCDVLLLDDIQLLKSSVYCQDHLAKLINTLRHEGKQIILSCDRHPGSFRKLMPGEKPTDDQTPQFTSILLNHLESCVAVGIEEPDLKTRMDVIRKKSENLPFVAEDREEICRFLSIPPRANVRLIESVLHWLDAMHKLNGVELSLRCIKQLLVSPQNDGATLTLKNISETVAASFRVDTIVLSSRRQDKGASLPRKVAMFLCRELTSETVEDVGKVFKRDYTSVIAAIQSLKKMMEDDEALAGRVRDLRYMLES